ncbi:uncharacterized protein LOC130811089 [Amaranthus tricolor]|uniref:uncharacterized protein LOC130811089 n=1 Tax=Amaranthus tricolor TaxID=29722 RepID=UPI00258AF5A0|nr:uncharacterized protein LOC130811089 [Amaranthus tricolor]XP_057533244.1 uncharacterized protein LOC130811089 [Amaranthus tricolor]XP_057533245.1 uncharacterized protein LOC130811089 [Amaranthus tricolor]XP_057533246.1 uncharacterized protein LOC130811089 [Amaranthus tricolor]
MEIDKTIIDQNMEEEYVLIDLDAVCGQVDIPPGEPYVLSGLDSPNPVLTIGNKLKLIGEYIETVGTCLVFSENEKSPSTHEETGSTQANLSENDHIADQNEDKSKQIKPLTSLHKILKFKLLIEADGQEQDLTEDLFDPPFVAEDTTNVN